MPQTDGQTDGQTDELELEISKRYSPYTFIKFRPKYMGTWAADYYFLAIGQVKKNMEL